MILTTLYLVGAKTPTHSLYSSYLTILLVQEKDVLHVSGTYHSSSTDVYQLSIPHLFI
jgi:hypothetical protein